MASDDELEVSLINYLTVSGEASVSSESEVDEEKCLDAIGDTSVVLSEVLQIAGPWGAHRFERHPWCRCKRRTVKIKEVKDLILNDSEKEGVLSDRVLAACSSFVEKSPVVSKLTYCKCVLKRMNLVDITVLKTYNYLQYLDISHNLLSSLFPLGQLPFLQYLDASHNVLTDLLDFKAPLYLTYVDFSHNFIKEIPELSDFWSIVTLKLACNHIEAIDGLQSLRFLVHLDLSNNIIRRLENLNNLRIQTLLLNKNLIEAFDDDADVGFHTLQFLVSVDLSNNKLTTLKPFQSCEHLEYLKLCRNNIQNLLELYYLRSLSYLSCLNLTDNPITNHAQYVNVAITTLRSLKNLDNSHISPEQKVNAKFRHSTDPVFKAREDRMNLLLLEYFNDPIIGAHIVPYDQPPPEVMLVVGPVCSKKKALVLEFVERNRWAILGVSHTTRPKQKHEEEGKHYYYVDRSTFKNMMMKGEFITVSESYGHLFGISHTELGKYPDGVLVFDSDITTALMMKVIGICPKIVLAMPRTEETHLEWLARNYFFQYFDYNSVLVQKCPDTITTSTQAFDSSSDSIVLDEDAALDDLIESLHEFYGEEFEDGARDIHFQNEDPLESDMPSIAILSDSSKSGILKNKSSSRENVRQTAVSFSTDDGRSFPAVLVEDKFENKKVSFGWLQGMDLAWIKEKIRHKSISDTMLISRAMEKSLAGNSALNCPLLSVLSSQNIETCNKQKETVYMSFTERFEQMQKETLDVFFKSVIKSRDELLELHWENPGLFRDIIFTDEMKESLSKLKDILRSTVQNRRCDTVSFEDDKDFTEALKIKIQNLDLEKNKYLR